MNFRVVLASIFFLVLFLIDGPGYRAPRSFKAVWDLGHVGVFSIWSYLLLIWLNAIERRPFRRQAAIILMFALLMGAGIEILQGYTYRTPSVKDVMRDVLGALIAIVFLAPKRAGIKPLLLRTFKAVVIVLTAIALYPLGCAVADEYMARRDFPVLSTFNNNLELSRWSCKTGCTIVKGMAPDGGGSLKVPLATTKYSGTFLEYFPSDWRGYNTLRFKIYNESPEPLAITCRINDGLHEKGIQHYHDRYNKDFILNPGWNDLHVSLSDVAAAPRNRRMDMSDITKIGFFVTRLKKEMNIYVDDVVLVR